MSFPADDLQYAHVSGMCADVHLVTGERYFTGVHEVNAKGGYVSLHAPQTMGDDATLRKVALDLISSVAVTDIAWH